MTNIKRYVCVRGYCGWDCHDVYFRFNKGEVFLAREVNYSASYTFWVESEKHFPGHEIPGGYFEKEFKSADEAFQDKLDGLLE